MQRADGRDVHYWGGEIEADNELIASLWVLLRVTSAFIVALSYTSRIVASASLQ